MEPARHRFSHRALKSCERSHEKLDRECSFLIFQGGPTAVSGSFRNGMKNKTTDDILRNRECSIAVMDEELSLLADSEAWSRFFQFGTGWKWLGAANDLGTYVWRIRFQDAQEMPGEWEVWISQESPRRITRIIMSRVITYGIGNMDEGGLAHSDKIYKARQQLEFRFSKWDVTRPIEPAIFERPQGEFRAVTFDSEKMRFQVGDKVPLPVMDDSKGATIVLSKEAGPVVLDFWFAGCGPCREWSPKVAKLVKEFEAQGTVLYGVNGTDTAEQVERFFDKQQEQRMPTLMDGKKAYQDIFSVTSFPTVVPK
jgi:peroxiredoxin